MHRLTAPTVVHAFRATGLTPASGWGGDGIVACGMTAVLTDAIGRRQGWLTALPGPVSWLYVAARLWLRPDYVRGFAWGWDGWAPWRDGTSFCGASFRVGVIDGRAARRAAEAYRRGLFVRGGDERRPAA